jgi:hypothetical protein
MTSALGGGVVSATPRPRFTPGEKTPGTHWIGAWVGLRVGLDTDDRGKIVVSAGDRTPVIQSVVRHCTDRARDKYFLTWSCHRTVSGLILEL